MISLGTQLGRVRRRLLGIGTAAGAVWGLAAATVLLLLGAWLDLLWEFSPEWRIATLWAAGASGAMLLAVLAVATVRAARDAAVARRLDRRAAPAAESSPAGNFEQGRYGIRGAQPARRSALTAGLASLAVADAAAAAGQVPLGRRPAAAAGPLAGGARVCCGPSSALLAVCLPGLAWTQWNRFLHPYADVPPFSLTKFEVTPGNKHGALRQRTGDSRHGLGPRWNNWNWSWNRPTARNRRCRCFPSRTAFGGPCWPRWSSRPITSSAPIAPAARSITSASSRCR